MECYDASSHVYYPHHEEYVGPRNDLRGRCCRCMLIIDAATVAAAKKADQRADAEVAASRDQDEESRRQYQQTQARRDAATSGRVRPWEG